MTEEPSGAGGGSPFKTPLTRRQFLTGTAAASLAAVMVEGRGKVPELVRALVHDVDGGLASSGGAGPIPNFTFSVVRPSDLVLLDIFFYGFSQQSVNGAVSLVPNGVTSVIVVQFPPQCIGEAAYDYVANPWEVDPPPVLSGMSGVSCLCFVLPNGQPVNFSNPMVVADLLDWTNWTILVPSLSVAADPRSVPSGTSMAGKMTYIEYPYGLILAPQGSYSGTNGLKGTKTQVTTSFTSRQGGEPLISPNQVSDCWTAALQQAQTLPIPQALVPKVAAVWSVDYQTATNKKANATYEQFISYEPSVPSS